MRDHLREIGRQRQSERESGEWKRGRGIQITMNVDNKAEFLDEQVFSWVR